MMIIRSAAPREKGTAANAQIVEGLSSKSFRLCEIGINESVRNLKEMTDAIATPPYADDRKIQNMERDDSLRRYRLSSLDRVKFGGEVARE